MFVIMIKWHVIVLWLSLADGSRETATREKEEGRREEEERAVRPTEERTGSTAGERTTG